MACSSFSGGGTAPSAFGPELRMQYARGNNRLDATYASMDTERVAEAWEGGARGIYDRAAHNITTQTNELIRLVSSPSAIADEFADQLSNAAEAASNIFRSSSNTTYTVNYVEPAEDELNSEDEDFGFDDTEEIDDAQ